jgi:hypothetical protein
MTTLAALLAILFLCGVFSAIRTYRFVRRSVRVRARVVERLDATVANHDPSSQSSSTWRYIVELSDQNGRKRRIALADAVGGSVADTFVAADATIAVIYDPGRPDVVRVDSPWTLYLMPVFLCAPGCLFLLLGIWVLIWA